MRSSDPLFIPARRAVPGAAGSAGPVLDPSRLLPIARRHWIWLLLPPLLLAGAGFLASSRQAERYEASTALIFKPTAAQDRLDGDRPNALAERRVQTEARLLNGPSFQAEVEEWFGTDVDFEAQGVEGTDVVELEVQSSSGPSAARAADEIAARYVERRRAEVRAELVEGIDSLQLIVDELQSELDEVDGELAGLADADPILGPAASISSGRSPAESAAALQRRQGVLADDLSAAQIALRALENDAILTNGDVATAAPTVVPTDPISPRPLRTTVLWAVLGTLLGMGLVWLREVSDRRLRGSEDLASVAPRLEFCGRILKPIDVPSTGPVSLLAQEVADRFRVLASNSVTPNGGSTVIQVAGLRGGEGATYVGVNLAVTLATGGWRTALVDADLNGGGVHRVFDVDQGPGTLDVLTGDPLSTVIVDSPMVPGLGIIPRGGPDVSPTVHNSSFTKMVNGLRSRFDVVVIDGPALLASGDAEVISRHVDKTVVVVEADTSIRDDLVTAVELVHMGGGLISGVALVETSRSVGKLARSDGPTGLLGGGRGIDRVNGRDSAAARPRSALRGPAARTPTRHVAQASRMIGTPDHRTASRPGTGSGDETAVR